MDVKCTNCSKEHRIPDESVKNKKVHFYCTQCGHKIVITGKRSLPVNKSIEKTEIPIFTDILNAVPLSFSFIPFLISFIFCAGTSVLIILLSVLFIKHSDFVAANLSFSIASAALFAAVIVYSYSMILYLISKIQVFRIEFGERTAIDWDFVLFDIKDDAITIFIFPVAAILTLSTILLPVYFLGEYCLIYTSLLFPAIFAICLIITFWIILQNFIPAIIATQSLSPLDSCLNIIRFIKREIVNIPFYLFFTKAVFVPFAVLFSAIFVLALAITAFMVSAFAGSQLPTVAIFGASIFSGLSSVPFHISVGIIIILFVLLIFFLILAAYLLNLFQTISLYSCWIMTKNPGRSVSRGLALAVMSFAFLIFALFFVAAVLVIGSGISARLLGNF